MSKNVEFFFDFGSPTSYLAYTQLPKLAAECGATLERLREELRLRGQELPLALPVLVRDLFAECGLGRLHCGPQLVLRARPPKASAGSEPHRLGPRPETFPSRPRGSTVTGRKSLPTRAPEVRFCSRTGRERDGSETEIAPSPPVATSENASASLAAVALTTMLPSVTWPSPPSATCPGRRTERMVVP